MSLFDNAKTITFGGKSVKKLELDGKVIWAELALKNWVYYSTESDGVTIYNNGKGYKDGYRVRSGGAEAEASDTTITGFIPFKKGDMLYIYPPFTGANTCNTINFYNSAYENLGQITDSGVCYGICTSAFKTEAIGGMSVLDFYSVNPSGVENVAFIRVGNQISGSGAVITSGSEMIVTINEEIPL